MNKLKGGGGGTTWIDYKQKREERMQMRKGWGGLNVNSVLVQWYYLMYPHHFLAWN